MNTLVNLVTNIKRQKEKNKMKSNEGFSSLKRLVIKLFFFFNEIYASLVEMNQN